MSTATAPAVQSYKPETANFLNLVVVDDERPIREACREVARGLGYNALAADSAGQCGRRPPQPRRQFIVSRRQSRPRAESASHCR